ncbi:peptidase C14 caspase catalytic subunit p20 [Streptomyces venezuelae]|uniref:Peptidase C14 caspase catalytic subunit p20 n=1 Tax=Streptomyces venezuelae TaxID=54571 RepID=A0A5P2D9A1_STRVZ|nr:caspase family protein [Streptomyces venezuelae]QES51656.1 peptidase C14 caspase catalytic subunit p20 [Streptomyces venezuelae]
MAADSADRPRRFVLATAVARIAGHPEYDVPELAGDVSRMTGLFTELGYEPVTPPGTSPAPGPSPSPGPGSAAGSEPRIWLDPTRAELTRALRAFCTDPARRPDDYLVCYVAAHGAVAPSSGVHYLMLADTDPEDLRGTALPTADLVSLIWEDTPLERVLLLLDCCNAEAGTDDALHAALQARRFRTPVGPAGPAARAGADGGPGEPHTTGLALIAASRRKDVTRPGALPAAFERAVRSGATAGRAPAAISLEHVMAAVSTDPQVPEWQRPVWSLGQASAAIPDFLPNPWYVPGAADLKVDEIDRLVALRSRERTARGEELLSHFLPRARGTDVPTEEVWDFTGRHQALHATARWLDARPHHRLCVVTGDPGSGKSSLLGMVTLLTDPVRAAAVPRDRLPDGDLPAPGAVHAAVHAGHKSTRQLLDAIAAAADCAADTLGTLTAALQRRAEPLIILVDSVDEALDPRGATDELLLPLADPELGLPLRLLLGARRHVARRLPSSALCIDLDEEEYADPLAVRAYARTLLTGPGSVLAAADPQRVDAVAEAIAEAAGRSFLVARITARTVAREIRVPDPADQAWRDALPRLPGEAMERDLRQRLGDRAGTARDLLVPLAFAQGVGLPWAGIWPQLATALAGRPYGDADLFRLRDEAGSYMVESVEDGGSVYRVYHRALIEYLREGRDERAVEATVTAVLRAAVDRHRGGWRSAHPYVRRYLALHAGAAGVLDELVQDAEFVLACAPGQLMAALPGLHTPAGRRAGAAVREREAELRGLEGRPGTPEARARLRLAAVCRGAAALADSCDPAPGEERPEWRARWAVWNPHGGKRDYAGVSDWNGLVVPRAGGGADFCGLRDARTLFRCDLDSGEQPADAQLWGPQWLRRGPWAVLPGQRGRAAVVLDDFIPKPPEDSSPPYGRRTPRVESAWELRVLDVRSGDMTSWRLPLPPGEPASVQRTPLDVAVVPGRGDTGLAILRVSPTQLFAYRLGSRPGRPGLTRAMDRVGDDYERQQAQERSYQRAAVLLHSLGNATGPVSVCAVPDGLPEGTFLLGLTDGDVVKVNAFLEHGMTTTPIPSSHRSEVLAMAVIHPHPLGRLLVSGGRDGRVQITPMSSSSEEPARTVLKWPYVVTSVAVLRSDRQWLIAAATADGLVHRIDVESGRPIGRPLHVGRWGGRLSAFRIGVTDCVAVWDGGRGLQLYDLVSGERIGGQEDAHEVWALARVDGIRSLGGSDGIVRLLPTPHAVDAQQFVAHDRPVLALGEIRGPAGVPCLISVGADLGIRCWDPGRRAELWTRPAEPLPPGITERTDSLAHAVCGRTADGLDYVATTRYVGLGRVRILLLDAGVPVREQEFTAPGPVTALCAGRVRGRDVVVAGTDDGRILCWDLADGGRPFGQNPPAADGGAAGPWITALALAPDGSGRLAGGAGDGTLRLWCLPGGRLLSDPVAAHRRPVTALSFVTADGPDLWLASAGDDHRLAVHEPDGRGVLHPVWERRTDRRIRSLYSEDRGLACGDEGGGMFLLVREPGGGWTLTDGREPVPSGLAVATTSLGGRPVCVSPDARDGLLVHDLADGATVRRLASACGSGYRAVAAARRHPAGALVVARNHHGLLERWDFTDSAALAPAGTPLRLSAPHEKGPGGKRLTALPDPAGETEDLFSLSAGRGFLAVEDLESGPLLHQMLWAGRHRGLHALRPEPVPVHPHRLGYDAFRLRFSVLRDAWVVRCGGHTFGFAETAQGVWLADPYTGRWARARLDGAGMRAAFTAAHDGAPGVLLVHGDRARFYALTDLLAALARPEPPLEGLRFLGRERLLRRGGGPVLRATAEHATPHAVRHAAPLPGGHAYVAAGTRELHVRPVDGGPPRHRVELPSPCTGLAVSPAGEIAVATRNGLLLFDPPGSPDRR